MNSFKKIVFVISIGFMIQANAQKQEETLNKEVSIPNNASEYELIAKNINGPITVTGYEGNSVQVTINKVIKADDQEDVDRGMEELTYKLEKKGNRIVLYPDAPFIQYNNNKKWGLQINGCGNEGPDYDFYAEYTIKIPRKMKLSVSTINRGDVKVSNVQTSELDINNINGAITLDKVSGKSKISTINGNIDVVYVQNPGAKSSYSTINGKITLHCLKNLGADVSFESMHGDFYTDFDVTEVVSNTTKSKKSGKRDIAYVIKTKPVMKIGKGGTAYDFKTLNGDVYIKRI
ncbi:DUF4097 family beta strand repeat-containing protein [Spongiivirga citrea]|uniref:DUF4097 domain-containing protein n=1 Tax=Spongiivirga citrea TaxID=1481457 RepID=A0A6M0CFR5_9FLAO|nr:DUF4097 family beta strand repeat-containing protein [Spongiivirga citrea]NER16651.1 hypothetical protein [Spongiivirga citrea]